MKINSTQPMVCNKESEYVNRNIYANLLIIAKFLPKK